MKYFMWIYCAYKSLHYISKNIPYRVNHSCNFIVGLSCLSSVEGLGNPGQSFQVIMFDHERNQLHKHQNVLSKRMIMKSGTYTNMLVEPDVKSIVRKSFFVQWFYKSNLLLVVSSN